MHRSDRQCSNSTTPTEQEAMDGKICLGTCQAKTQLRHASPQGEHRAPVHSRAACSSEQATSTLGLNLTLPSPAASRGTTPKWSVRTMPAPAAHPSPWSRRIRRAPACSHSGRLTNCSVTAVAQPTLLLAPGEDNTPLPWPPSPSNAAAAATADARLLPAAASLQQ